MKSPPQSLDVHKTIKIGILPVYYILSHVKEKVHPSPVPRWPVAPRPAAGKVVVPSSLSLFLLPPSSVSPVARFEAPPRDGKPAQSQFIVLTESTLNKLP